ncbi:MAG: HAD-IA family hydrolase [Muribaculaceae bacterium]|nr:HAD-IA family hydrolase [Muribaculaceae bacterium]
MAINKDIACLFDLDGVLVDSERIYTKIWEAIECQWPTGVENFPYKIKGTTLEDILHKYFPAEIRQQVTEELYRLEGMMVYEPKPGAMKLLEKLREDEVATALVTSSNDLKMAHLWNDMPNLKGEFRTIITGDEVTHSKPDPEGYLKASSALGVDSRRCAVFEDSLQGVKAGRASGAFVVGVAGTLKAEDIAPYCDIVVDTLEGFDCDNLESILHKR